MDPLGKKNTSEYGVANMAIADIMQNFYEFLLCNPVLVEMDDFWIVSKMVFTNMFAEKMYIYI